MTQLSNIMPNITAMFASRIIIENMILIDYNTTVFKRIFLDREQVNLEKSTGLGVVCLLASIGGVTCHNLDLPSTDIVLPVIVTEVHVLNNTCPYIVTESVHFELPFEVVPRPHP